MGDVQGVPTRPPVGLDGSLERPTGFASGRAAARRMVAWVLEFTRELDRGYAVMYGQRPPDQPTPAELDALVRAGVVRPPRQQR